MRPTGQRWHVRNQHELNALVEWLESELDNNKGHTLQIMADDRSSKQNKMIHGLYGDIARNVDGQGIVDIKRYCKLHLGIPILRASDPKYLDWYDSSVKPLPYETKLMLMDHLEVTSLFTVGQGTEYITSILREYSSQGVHIPDPRR